MGVTMAEQHRLKEIFLDIRNVGQNFDYQIGYCEEQHGIEGNPQHW